MMAMLQYFLYYKTEQDLICFSPQFAFIEYNKSERSSLSSAWLAKPSSIALNTSKCFYCDFFTYHWAESYIWGQAQVRVRLVPFSPWLPIVFCWGKQTLFLFLTVTKLIFLFLCRKMQETEVEVVFPSFRWGCGVAGRLSLTEVNSRVHCNQSMLHLP
jgi:hypothetical protein